MYICYFCDVSYRSFQSYKQHFERKYLCKRSMDMDIPDEKINNETSISANSEKKV